MSQQIRYIKRTIVKTFVKSGEFQATSQGPILDIAIKNVGTTDLYYIINGSTKETLKVGSAMLSLGSYDGAICDDIIKISFAAGAGSRGLIFANKVPLFFSLEMTRNAILDRMVSIDSKIPLWKLRRGEMSPEEMKVFHGTLSRYFEKTFIIDDKSNMDIDEIKAKARLHKKRKNIDCIFVDYIQRINPPKAGTREREVAMLSLALAGLAKELEIPVIALAQLNREVEKRPDKKPMLADLKDSGGLEQDADNVLFLYRPEYYGLDTFDDKGTAIDRAEILVRKQRNGATGDVRVEFNKELVCFKEINYYVY